MKIVDGVIQVTFKTPSDMYEGNKRIFYPASQFVNGTYELDFSPEAVRQAPVSLRDPLLTPGARQT